MSQPIKAMKGQRKSPSPVKMSMGGSYVDSGKKEGIKVVKQVKAPACPKPVKQNI